MPPEFIIFLDENHHRTPAILKTLHTAGVKVERHEEHFLPGTPDIEWLPIVGQNQWLLLTSDRRIRHRHLEWTLVNRHKLRVFCFSSNNISGEGLADALGRALQRMRIMVNENPPPFIATITKSGDIAIRDEFTRTRRTP